MGDAADDLTSLLRDLLGGQANRFPSPYELEFIGRVRRWTECILRGGLIITGEFPRRCFEGEEVYDNANSMILR